MSSVAKFIAEILSYCHGCGIIRNLMTSEVKNEKIIIDCNFKA